MTRRTTPPTVEQLLVLADRAERGQLTAAEAARLRAGIAGLTAPQRRVRHQPRSGRQVAAIAALVRRTQARGAQAVPVWALERILGPAQQAATATRSEAA